MMTSINFLDINVDTSTGHSITKTYIKPTNSGTYLNVKSEYDPRDNKDATVQASLVEYIPPTSKSSQTSFINNAYPNCTFDKILSNYLAKIHTYPCQQNPAIPPIFSHLKLTPNSPLSHSGPYSSSAFWPSPLPPRVYQPHPIPTYSP